MFGIAGTSSTSQVAESSNLEPPQSSNITPAFDAQDSFSQCTQGTNDFDLQNILESLTRSAVQNSSALPVQSPTAHLPSSSSTLTLQSLQQPCISLPSMSFLPTTVSLPATTVSQTNSQGQLVLGTGVNFNIRPPSILQSLPVVSNIGSPTPRRTANRNSKPFTLKLSSFEIEIPKELIPKLTIFQKVYLMTCLNVPPVKLDLEV